MKKLRDVEISVKQKKKQESKFKMDSLLTPHEGHPIYEVDLEKKVIKFAKLKPLETINFLTWKEQLKEQDILRRANCLYIYSLNETNLRRKLKNYNKELCKFPFDDEKNKLSLHKNRKIKVFTYED
jgi:hypothetical protein